MLVLLEGGSSALLEKSENLHILAGLDISAETFVTTWVGRPTGILTNLDVTAAHVATIRKLVFLPHFLHDKVGCLGRTIMFELQRLTGFALTQPEPGEHPCPLYNPDLLQQCSSY